MKKKNILKNSQIKNFSVLSKHAQVTEVQYAQVKCTKLY